MIGPGKYQTTCVHIHVALCSCIKCFFSYIISSTKQIRKLWLYQLGKSRLTMGSFWFFPLTFTRRAFLTSILLMFTVSVISVLPKFLNKVVMLAQSLYTKKVLFVHSPGTSAVSELPRPQELKESKTWCTSVLQTLVEISGEPYIQASQDLCLLPAH